MGKETHAADIVNIIHRKWLAEKDEAETKIILELANTSGSSIDIIEQQISVVNELSGKIKTLETLVTKPNAEVQ